MTDLEYFRSWARQLILDEVDVQLPYEPTVQTNNRKRLRPNQLAEWELRIGKYRVLYDAIIEDELQLCKIYAVGYKERNKLYIRGKEFRLFVK